MAADPQIYDWSLTLSWPAGAGQDTHQYAGQADIDPGTAERYVLADALAEVLPRVPQAARAAVTVEDFTLTRDGRGRKFHQCGFCWSWVAVETGGPFAGKLIAHTDEETRRQCGGSRQPAEGPARNWPDGRAPRNLPAPAQGKGQR